MPPFGRAIRPLWELEEGAAFLNHGSFGACPKPVLAEQERIRRAMEADPDAFFRERIVPREEETELRAAAKHLGAFVNASRGDLAFVENATAGVQAVLRSVAFGAGDRILVTDHTYNAVRLMVQAHCEETGAEPRVVHIPVPTTAEEIVSRFAAAFDPSVKLAIVDHIASPTAIVMPLERIVALAREAGALVLVDGAHGVGQVSLDLAALDCDWYVSNAHKWLFAPKGSAFLYASDAVAPMTRPNVVSHFIAMGFPRSFDFTGTRDNSAWLATPAAVRFFEDLDPAAAWAYQRGLVAAASDALAPLGACAVAPLETCAAMRSFVLPQDRAATEDDALALMRTLWREERIRAQAVKLGDLLLYRFSAQVYVDEDDVRRLAAALARHGWPGRA